MEIRTLAGLTALILLGACAVPGPAGDEAAREVPASVVALAAPGQDVQTARVLPEDGCYWYRHAGPVETTLLPLLTPDGRRICTTAAPAPAAADAR